MINFSFVSLSLLGAFFSFAVNNSQHPSIVCIVNVRSLAFSIFFSKATSQTFSHPFTH